MTPPRVFPWLPVGFAVCGEFRVRRVLCEGPDGGAPAYQVVDAQTGDDRICAMVRPDLCPPEAVRVLDNDDAGFAAVDFPGESIRAAVFAPDASPVKVSDIPLSVDYMSGKGLPMLAAALADISGHGWGGSLYLPAIGRCVPFGKPESATERRLLAARILTGGVADAALSPRQIHAVNKWIQPEEAAQFFRALNLPADPGAKSKAADVKARSVRATDEFVLPGQPCLEKFFRERVIHYHHKRKEYERMGVRPVGGVLLYGPPGTGKTFSVKALADFLGWPMMEVNIGGVGAPYIHETSMQLKRAFDRARKRAPAILFMDEIDALGGRRNAGAHKHEVEEVATLLTAMESVIGSGVFVVAATNRKSALDPALLRSGRFDEHIEVAPPGPAELLAVLEHCISRRPHSAGIDLAAIAEQLAGCNLGDVERLVNDAGHFAVHAGKAEIDDECLKAAMDGVRHPSKPARIGF